jgi:multimeric flavodoxin WrbA
MNNTVIILGSSRSYGNTRKIVEYISKENNIKLVDLNDYNIGYFDYDFKNATDDFIPLMEKLINENDTFIFVTPVYWYAMSGILKVFFDRFSDLLHYKKELGRKLRGKNMAMLSNSNQNDLIGGFEIPFIASANYLGMNYLGGIHTWVENNRIPKEVSKSIDEFISKINTFE